MVSTWTMCTIPDLAGALAEVRRVLRAGGSLRFVEHGLAPDPGVQRWQHLIQPVWGRVAGGCHLDRDIVGRLTAAGLVADPVSSSYTSSARPFSWFTVGCADPG